MAKYFVGKRILVTGGCSGIGKGTATELCRCGASVVALSHQAESLEKLKQECPDIETACVDLRDWEKTKEVVDSLGVFDGLVNSAGFIITQPFLECSPDIFEQTNQVNATAILNISQIVAKKMIANQIKGSIVNISSQASMVALKDHVAYCASKGAVDAMTRVMALELGPHGIRVNTINPTVVMTELGRRVWACPEKSGAMLAKIPLGRFGEVHEVVNAILFLLSDKSSMISGRSSARGRRLLGYVEVLNKITLKKTFILFSLLCQMNQYILDVEINASIINLYNVKHIMLIYIGQHRFYKHDHNVNQTKYTVLCRFNRENKISCYILSISNKSHRIS